MLASIGVLELLTLLLMGGSSFGGLPLGLPPGDRDPVLWQAPPDGCIVYVEWAARGEGRPEAPGVDGFFADPEIVDFVQQAERAIIAALRADNRPEPQTIAEHGLPLGKSLLNSPGCLFLSLATDDLPPREDFPNFALIFTRLKAGLIVNAGSAADDVQTHLTRMCELSPVKLPETLNRFVLPLPVPGGGLTLHRAESRFVLCYGQGTLDAVLAGLGGKRQGLAGDERITAALQEVAVDRPSRLAWLDVSAVIEAADTIAGHSAMVEETVAALGFDGVRHLASAVGVDGDGRLYSRSHLHTDGRRQGLLTVLTGRPLTPRDFAHIPADADLVVAKSVPLGPVLDAVRTIVRQADAPVGEKLDAALEAVEQELGVSIGEDLLTAFGDVWTLYDSPANGGVLLSAPVLAVEVADPQRAYAAFTQLMQSLDQALPAPPQQQFRRRGVTLAQQKFLDRTIYFVNTIGDDDVPVAPAFCVTDTHLLAALHPQTLKAHLRFVAGKDSRLGDVLMKGSAVSDRQLVYFSRVDTAAVMRYLTAVTPWMGQIAFSGIQANGGEIDVFSLPSARALLPYASESSGWIEVTDHGVTCESRNGFPLGGLMPGTLTLPTVLLGTFWARASHEVILREHDVPAVEVR